MSKVFESNSEFSEWLDKNYWFEDGYCLEISHKENSNSISLKLAYQIAGTYEANTERTLRVFSLLAEGLKKHTESTEVDWLADHCMEGVELKESSHILFSLDTPKIIEVECERIIVTECENVVEIVEPWLSETEIFIRVKSDSLPTPDDWLSWFNAWGHDLGWRYYSGELKETTAVPRESYDGWYLQEKQLIPKTTQGLFFRLCKKEGWGFSISFQRSELNDKVWKSLKKLLLEFSNVEIHCGNCKFNKEEWGARLNSPKIG